MIWLRSRLYLCFTDFLSCEEAKLFLHLGGFYNSVFFGKSHKVVWKGVSLYCLYLIGLSMPQESQASCALPVCQCPVMGTPLNSVFCQRAVQILFRDMLQQHIGVKSYYKLERSTCSQIFSVLLNILSAAIDCYYPWETHPKWFREELINTLIMENCDGLRFEDCW